MEKPAALLGHVAAQIDPYLFAYYLLGARRGRGIDTYDLTEVVESQTTKTGVILTTDRGFRIRARKVGRTRDLRCGLVTSAAAC